jgi:molybdenum cofactor biosynthesis enzyme MoaA
MSKKVGENFCVIPWMHFVLDGSEVLPCCRMYGRFSPEPLKKDLKESLNTDSFQNIRQNFLENRPPNECLECFKCESAGLLSRRNKYNVAYKEVIEEVEKNPSVTITEKDIRYADLRFSNKCNLSCRTCGPYFSTAWNKDALELGQIKNPIINTINKSMIPDLDNCHSFYFAGGEPLLEKEHSYYLTKLTERNDCSDITLRYNSNLDIKKIENFVEHWRKFKKVIIFASIDHIEKEKAEYIRDKCNWINVLNNLYLIQKLKGNIELNIQVTVSIFNVYDLPDIVDYFLYKLKLSPMLIELSLLQEPEIFSVRLLPDELKEKLTEKMKSYSILRLQEFNLDKEIMYLISNIKKIISYTNGSVSNEVTKNFVSKTIELDRIRNQSMLKVFPNLKQLT